MAKSTYLQLCQKVHRECGLSGNGASAVTSQTGINAFIVNAVADADVEIQSLWMDWDFLWAQFSTTTTQGEDDVSAPADIGMWDDESFYLDYSTATFKKLSVKDYKEWRATLRNGVLTNQKPDFVIILPDQNLKLHSPPDATYALTADYWKKPQRMAASSDNSLIPEEYERIIIARAKMMYAEYDSASDVMAASQVEYDYLLDRMEAKYLASQAHRRTSDPGKMTVIPQ